MRLDDDVAVMNGASSRSYGNPASDEKVDLHVLIVPASLWRADLRFAYKSTCSESVSAGFVRVCYESTLSYLRKEIESQLDESLLPNDYVFLRDVGRCLTWVTAKQESSLKAKLFVPPLAPCPEIYILDSECLKNWHHPSPVGVHNSPGQTTDVAHHHPAGTYHNTVYSPEHTRHGRQYEPRGRAPAADHPQKLSHGMQQALEHRTANLPDTNSYASTFAELRGYGKGIHAYNQVQMEAAGVRPCAIHPEATWQEHHIATGTSPRTTHTETVGQHHTPTQWYSSHTPKPSMLRASRSLLDSCNDSKDADSSYSSDSDTTEYQQVRASPEMMKYTARIERATCKGNKAVKSKNKQARGRQRKHAGAVDSARHGPVHDPKHRHDIGPQEYKASLRNHPMSHSPSHRPQAEYKASLRNHPTSHSPSHRPQAEYKASLRNHPTSHSPSQIVAAEKINNTSRNPTTQQEAVATTPEATQKVGATPKVGDTPKVEATQKVGATQKVETTQKFGATPKVGATAKVGATQKVGDIPKVEATSKDEATQKVEATPKFGATPKVEATQKVEATPKVGATQKVEATPKVGATQKVEATPKVEKVLFKPTVNDRSVGTGYTQSQDTDKWNKIPRKRCKTYPPKSRKVFDKREFDLAQDSSLQGSHQLPLPPITATKSPNNGHSHSTRSPEHSYPVAPLPPIASQSSTDPHATAASATTSLSEVNDLLAQIRVVKEECQQLEVAKTGLTSHFRSLQSAMRTKREDADKEWKRKFFQEKKLTSNLEDRIKIARNEIQGLQRRRQADKRESHIRDSIRCEHIKAPSENSNIKIQCRRLELSIQDLNERLQAARQKLISEKQVHRALTAECRSFRKELMAKKIAHTRCKPPP